MITDDLPPNNETVCNDDILSDCLKALYTMGELYYRAFGEILNHA